jgi:hypothetical protein
MATFTSIVGGSAGSPLDGTDGASWVGGVAPASSDDRVIPAGSYIQFFSVTFDAPTSTAVAGWMLANFAYLYGHVVAEAGGSVRIGTETINYGHVVAEAGGAVTFPTGSGVNSGFVVAEAGGAVTFESGTVNYGHVLAEPGGTVTFAGIDASGPYNYGHVVAESGGSVAFVYDGANSGFVGAYTGASASIANGNPPVDLGTERRTLHHTGDLAADAKITLLSAPAGDVYYHDSRLPAVADVRLATSYAAGDRTGTLALPATGNVSLGTTYGAAGTEFTGTATLTQADVQSALTAQGYTTTRAGYLDTLNGLVAAVWASGTRTLTAISDSAGITTLVGRITETLTNASVASAVWNAGARTLTGFGSLVSDVASAVWSAAVRTVTGGQSVSYTSPVDLTDDDRLNLVAGDDYTATGRVPSWTVTGWTGPALAAGGKLRLVRATKYARAAALSLVAAELEVDATIATAGSTLTITAPITGAQTAAITWATDAAGEDTHRYQLVGVDASAPADVVSVKIGPATVLRGIDEEDA